ncbi:ATP synthase F0 [Coleophoma cylindrospora]|uniref:ATP synthase F0 n=1 Tax=Coleophoma cylindrospora TaxID=1849047 RepID=A0A3D8R620_9HELO|nr:ATP synthase F0 [Coleophoma cylindrospora]
MANFNQGTSSIASSCTGASLLTSLLPVNPFSRRESHSAASVTTYKVLTILSWLLVVITSFYYSFNVPQDDIKKWRSTIWGVNAVYHTPFATSSVIASIYWIILFISQIGYVWHLFSGNTEYVNAAAGVGSHFILNNLLQFAWVMLFVRGHFIWSEILVIVNFFNLSFLYFRHNTHPRFIHFPVVSGPLAWSFFALYWNGAIGVNAHSLPARILANVAIWGILVYGLFFLVTFKDYTMGFALSVLTASLGVHQFLQKAFALQWIFAFAIMGTLFLATLVIAVPGIFGKEFKFGREHHIVDPDQERAPLLEDN